jgi:hypothetical protein
MQPKETYVDFPKGDDEFSETKITSVEKSDNGWFVGRDDGWSNYIEGTSPVEPAIGMTLRTYGRGTRVRGMFLDGQKVSYRTAAEDDEHNEIQMYGADAADWLARWDAGKSVWTIEMGGMGPGYEQCIHITAAEVLRHLLEAKYDPSLWQDKDVWKRDREVIEKYGFANKRIEALGLSGAQWGAAVSIATKLYMDGPRKIMNEPSIKDRHIQVQRTFPVAA